MKLDDAAKSVLISEASTPRKYKFSFTSARMDAHLKSGPEITAAEMEKDLNDNFKQIPVNVKGKPGTVEIKEPWKAYTSSFSPHGYGVPNNRVYAVTTYHVL